MLEVFPGNGRYVHYMDDGETLAYRSGQLRKIQITVRGHHVEQAVISDGYPGPNDLDVLMRA